MDFDINSPLYWNMRFQTQNWEENQGPTQTLFFGNLAINHLPTRIIDYIRERKFSICDYGCALGQATQLLTTYFPDSKITGIDISEAAIKKAQTLYPHIEFITADLTQSNQKFDIIFSSNTLEHFYNPNQVLTDLSKNINAFVILLLPFYDNLVLKEHFYSFTFDNIPRNINNKFHLIFYQEINTSLIANTHWDGSQILLIYANPTMIPNLESLADQNQLLKKDKNSYRIALIDTALKKESEIKTSILLQMKIKHHNEQSETRLAQERTHHIANQQELKQSLKLEQEKNYALEKQLEQAHTTQDFLQKELNHAHASISWLLLKFFRFVLRKSKRMLCYFFKITMFFEKYSPKFVIIKLHQHKKSFGLLATVRFTLQKAKAYILQTTAAPEVSNKNKTISGKNKTKLVTSEAVEKIYRLARFNIVKDVIFIESSFDFDDSRNQRTIALAKSFAADGHFVIFLRFQWGTNDHSHRDFQIFHDRILQFPRLQLNQILSFLKQKENLRKFYIAVIPDLFLLKNYVLIKNNDFKIIYDIIDNWEEFFKVSFAPWYKEHIEKFFVNNSDCVVAVSNYLVKKFSGSREVFLIPNGTFKTRSQFVYNDCKNYYNVGYVGHLTEQWFNWEYIFKLSEDKKFFIHIIGEGASSVILEKIEAIDNIKFYGYIPQNKLKSILVRFNVGLIPFIDSRLSQSVDPLKVYEYLQFGRPVVSVGTPHLSNYPYCKNASNFNEFKHAIIELYQETPIKKQIIDDWISNYYWPILSKKMINHLAESII